MIQSFDKDENVIECREMDRRSEARTGRELTEMGIQDRRQHIRRKLERQAAMQDALFGDETDPSEITQRSISLAQANVVRMEIADVKKDLRHKRINLFDALYDSRASSCDLYALVRSQYGWGRARTGRALNSVGITYKIRVGNMSNAQRSAVVLACKSLRWHV
jgi:hypothetical protein